MAAMAIERDSAEKSGAQLDLHELCGFTRHYESIRLDTTATQTRRGNQRKDPGSQQRTLPTSRRAFKGEDCRSRPQETQREGEREYRGGSASKVGQVSGSQEVGCGKHVQGEKEDDELRDQIETVCKDEGVLGSEKIREKVAFSAVLHPSKSAARK